MGRPAPEACLKSLRRMRPPQRPPFSRCRISPEIMVPTNEPLQSGVLTSPADAMLSRAVAATLQSPAAERAGLFTRLVREIETFMAAHPQERPWTCTVYTGTDGSTVFRGGVGHSLVVDSEGRLWRARSYEDFDTTYRLTDSSYEIETLTPLYTQMREYLLQQERA